MAYDKYHQICLCPVSSMFTDSLVATDISGYDACMKSTLCVKLQTKF